MIYIPTEMNSNILCRLPVKPLLRFRCVSKSWCKLIDNPGFIKSHRNHFLQLKSSYPDAKLIFYVDSTFQSIPFDSVDSETTDFPIVAKPRKLNIPFANDNDNIFFNTFCHGLFYIRIRMDLVLWNPSSREYQKFPMYEFKELPKGRNLFSYQDGFGYDETTDDYKVVNIKQVTSVASGTYSETAVYSLKSNCWRRIKEFPYWIHSWKAGVFLFGALHWPALVEDKFVIVALDLGTEDYEHVSMPQGLVSPSRVDLGELDGCLSMSCYYGIARVDIWLMKKHQDKESWTKLFSIGSDDATCFFRNVVPVAYSRCGNHVLLENYKKLVWYDLKKKAVKEVRITSSISISRTVTYMESFVHLNGGGDVGVAMKTDQTKMKESKTKNSKRDDFLSKGFKLKL